MASGRELRSQLLRLAARILKIEMGESDAPVTVIIVRGEMSVTTTKKPRVRPPPEPSPELGLRPLYHDLLQALTATPVTARVLARKSGHPYNSDVRAALAQLDEMGLLRRVRGKYRLPDR